jgi:outer membrane beta-barrel protein
MRSTFKLLSCIVALASLSAFAEGDEGELVEKVAVRNRLFSVEKRFEFGGNVGFTLLPKLTDHYNFNLSGAYNVTDWLGVELRAGYAYSRHTGLAADIQDKFYLNRSGFPKVNDASDLWEMTGNAVIGARFQPIYGKINLMSELPVHFQLYGWVGGGAVLLKKESMVFCVKEVNTKACVERQTGQGQYYTENKVSPLVSLAFGFRFFVGRESKHSIKLETRSWSYLDSFQVDAPTAKVGDAAPGGTPSTSAGITTMAQIDIGYAFIF